MTNAETTTLFVTAITGLSAAVVYLYKRGEKREKETQQMVKDVLNAIRSNESFINNSGEVLRRVEKLLTNWRGH